MGFRAPIEGNGEEKNSLNPGPSSLSSLNINYTNSWAGGGRVCVKNTGLWCRSATGRNEKNVRMSYFSTYCVVLSYVLDD